MWKSLSPLLLTLYFSGIPSVAMTRGDSGCFLGTEQLRAGPQTHIQPLLQEVAGLQMQSATRSTARLTLRGMGSRTPYASNRVKAYFNDIPLTSGDGATIIEDLELSTLQSVEVLKGPASALYGPALGGVIVLRTSKAKATDKTAATDATTFCWRGDSPVVATTWRSPALTPI